MSLRALLWAFETPVDSSAQKLVLLAISNFANADGIAYPAVATVCRLTHLHDETVRKALDDLQAAGLIGDTLDRKGATQQVKVYEILHSAAREPKTPENSGLKDSGKTRERLGEDPGFSGAIREQGTVNTKSLKRFVKPTMPEMELEAQKIGLPASEITSFFNHHEARGWKFRTGLPMVSWRAAMVTWRENSKKFASTNGGRTKTEHNGKPWNPEPLDQELRKLGII